MKIIFLPLLALPSIGFPQIQIKLFFDSDWNQDDSINASYYRIYTADKNGQPIGWVKDYYKSGKIQFTGRMSSIEPEKMKGKCIWYYENGQVAKIERFNKEGDATGQCTYYYENGKKWSRGKWFPHHGKQGKWKFWYDNGRLSHTGCYEKGDKTGIHKYWYPNGSRRMIQYDNYYATSIYWNEKGEKRILIHSDGGFLGLLDSAGQMFSVSANTTQIKDNITIVNEDPSQPTLVDINTYSDFGLKEGPNKIYNSEGKLKYEFVIRNGLMHGIFIKYDENGIKEDEYSFRNNQLHGKTLNYNSHGTAYYMRNYRKGRQHGISKKWHDTALVEEKNYRKGKLHGWSRYVDFWDGPSGSSPEWYVEQSFKRGEPRSSKFFYVDAATLKPTFPMTNIEGPFPFQPSGKYTGTYIFYHNNGKVKVEQRFAKGDPVGTGTMYYRNGKKQSEGVYTFRSFLSGMPDKLYSYWDSLGNPIIQNGYGTIIRNEQGRRSEMAYQNGCLIHSAYYHPNGNLSGISRTSCPDGQFGRSKVLEEVWYDEDGIKFQEKTVNDSTEVITGWYRNGNKKLIRTNSASDPNVLAGLWIDYYENGRVSMEGMYNNGRRTGTWKYYNENGKLNREEIYKYGRVKETIHH